MLSAMEIAYKKLREDIPEKGSVFIFSMDALALYPFPDLQDVIKSIWKLITTSRLQFKNVNMIDVRKNVAFMYSEEEMR